MHDNQPQDLLPPPLAQPLLAIAVGNTRTRVGLFEGRDLREPEAGAGEQSVTDIVARAKAAGAGAIVAMATVAPDRSREISDAFAGAGLERPLEIGRDLPIPLRHGLDDSGATTVGQDRLLNALAAHRTSGQACIVVDAGTAVTVDFIDGGGVFQGGLIAPGLGMMLRALHEHTEALPEVAFEVPGEDPAFARNTPDAMKLGVALALRGLVRAASERFAIAYDAYPPIIATGGDAGVLEDDGVIERIVPDLQLMGIRIAAEAAAADLDDDDADDE